MNKINKKNMFYSVGTLNHYGFDISEKHEKKISGTCPECGTQIDKNFNIKEGDDVYKCRCGKFEFSAFYENGSIKEK